MLRELKVEGLKSFGDRQVLDLAPITLIYGPNSAGKSTLIQSLMLLKQSIENQGPDEPSLVMRGPIVDLGSFRSAIHGHDDTRPLRLGISFDAVEARRRRGVPNRMAGGRREVELEYYWDPSAEAVQLRSTTLEFEREFRGTFYREFVEDSEVPLLGTPGRREFFTLRDVESKQSLGALLVAAERIRSERHRSTSRDRVQERLGLPNDSVSPVRLFEWLTKELEDKYAIPYFLGLGAFPVRLYDIDGLSPSSVENSGSQSMLHAWFESKIGPDARGVINTTHFSLSNLLTGLAEEVNELMVRLTYLGPLRRAPQRFHLFSGAHRESVGREGEFFTEILAQRPGVIREVNEWLERLDVPYSMDVERLQSGGMYDTIGDVVSLILKDTRSGVLVSPSDVGFGISQMLPIVVQSLFVRDATICVEQPEIHVHPRLQAELADMFASATQDRGNQFIIETHSEHLMLRLQRRIREGHLSPEAVRVLYVEPTLAGDANVLPLELDGGGEFTDEWPQGFFEERFREMFL